MSTYSIKKLGLLSGVKPHTIRIWEQRYELLKPYRTKTNIRYYDDEHLKKLLNVCELMNAGMKISHIGELDKVQLASEIDKVIAGSFEKEFQFDAIISQALIAAATYDEALFEKIFSNAILRFGFVKTYIKIIYPLLVRVGLMWGKGDIIPAQEHFFSNLIKQKLFASIDALPLPAGSEQTWVLFLAEHEEHEIGILFANYLLRLHGKKVIYLGCKVPYENLASVVGRTNPSHIYTFFVKNCPIEKASELLSTLVKDFKDSEVLVSGREDLLNKIKPNKRVTRVADIDKLIKLAE